MDEKKHQYTMTITIDTEQLGDTSRPFVTFRCDTMPIPFWQMVVGEIVRQLEDLRDTNKAMVIRNKMIEDAKNAEIAAMLAGNNNPTRRGGPRDPS